MGKPIQCPLICVGEVWSLYTGRTWGEGEDGMGGKRRGDEMKGRDCV